MAVSLNIVYLHAPGAIPQALAAALRRDGHTVRCMAPARLLADAVPADVLIVPCTALAAPAPGVSLGALLAACPPRAGLIALTNPVADKVEAYANGADLCLGEPATEDELAAAVRALARRCEAPDATLPAPLLQLDATGLRLHGPQGGVALSPSEASLLAALAAAPGQRLSFAQLMAQLGRGRVPDATNLADKASLEVRMVRLRAKLKQLGVGAPGIQAVRRYGYQLCVGLRPFDATHAWAPLPRSRTP